jgi:hypothetical protein
MSMNPLPEKADDPEPLVDGRAMPPWRAALGRGVHRVSTLAVLGLGFGLTLAWIVFLCWLAYAVLRLMIE